MFQRHNSARAAVRGYRHIRACTDIQEACFHSTPKGCGYSRSQVIKRGVHEVHEGNACLLAATAQSAHSELVVASNMPEKSDATRQYLSIRFRLLPRTKPQE